MLFLEKNNSIGILSFWPRFMGSRVLIRVFNHFVKRLNAKDDNTSPNGEHNCNMIPFQHLIMPQSKPAPVYYDRWRLTARIICCIIYWAGDIPQSLITWCVAVRVGVVPEIYSWQINISSFNCTQVVCTFRKMEHRKGVEPLKITPSVGRDFSSY